jgi:hypothetical protein
MYKNLTRLIELYELATQTLHSIYQMKTATSILVENPKMGHIAIRHQDEADAYGEDGRIFIDSLVRLQEEQLRDTQKAIRDLEAKMAIQESIGA